MMKFWTLGLPSPSTMELLWNKTCPKELRKQWTTAHKNLVCQAFVGYILRVYTFVELCRLLKEVPGTLQDWREIRTAMVQKFETVLGIKLFILRCLAQELNKQPVKLKSELQRNGLHPNDAQLYYALEAMGIRNQIIKTLYKLPVKTIPNAKQVIAECTKTLADTQTFFDKFAARKLRFIYEGNNFKHEDMVRDLQLKATEAFYLVTPFLTEEHRVSTAKRAGHNQGMKLIKYYTDPCRARVRKVGGKFENTIRVLSDSDENSERSDNDYGHTVFAKVACDTHNAVALRNYIKQNSYSLPIISLLTLKDDENFLKFIEIQTQSHFNSVEHAYDIIGADKYYELIARYLKLKTNKVMQVVLELQNTLALDR